MCHQRLIGWLWCCEPEQVLQVLASARSWVQSDGVLERSWVLCHEGATVNVRRKAELHMYLHGAYVWMLFIIYSAPAAFGCLSSLSNPNHWYQPVAACVCSSMAVTAVWQHQDSAYKANGVVQTLAQRCISGKAGGVGILQYSRNRCGNALLCQGTPCSSNKRS